MPWQLAERDASYYTRTRELLGWPSWTNWKADCMGMEGYMPMVWACKLSTLFTRHIERAQHAPRQTWLLGNEPESRFQSDTTPSEFADAARSWLALVGISWAGPGILWGDEGRAWLDEYLRLGGPLPSAWAIHIYGSADVQGWSNQYTHARRWLAEHNAVRPIWVTETNGSEALMRTLYASPLVAYWYCTHDGLANMGYADLHDAGGQLTHLGHVYRELRGVQPAGRNEHNSYFPFLPG